MKAETLSQLQDVARSVPRLIEMFAASPTRSSDFTCDAAGVHFDFSRQRISPRLWNMLLHVAQDADVLSQVSRMFGGELVNKTEGRAALHSALRAHPSHSAEAAWASAEMARALKCAELIRNDQRITTVINIGIGGSDLGPAMATRALRNWCNGPDVRFVSNVDAADLDAALHGLQPEHTVFIVSSKTFTTSETMHNANRARMWLANAGVSWSSHFYASTSNVDAATTWGISPDNCFEFKEWVGGRYSVSSVIGLPIACAIGAAAFEEFLSGMRQLDQHVSTESVPRNLAVVHALVWFANTVLHEYPSVAVVPYSHDLGRLPAYLQQLVMESNGKSVLLTGETVSTQSSPVVWGEPGTNGQHAFFQMLHQGTQVVPVEFVGVVNPLGSDSEAHDILIANMLAQSEALAAGDINSDPHRTFSGNRPSSVLMLNELSPRSLGVLLAMYEHSTAIQGWLLGVNSFDQFGVELGKTIAASVLTAIKDSRSESDLTMTHPLLDWYLEKKKNISTE